MFASKSSDWHRRVITAERVGDDHPPTWFAEAYQEFHQNVGDEKYPCYFGSRAERDGAHYYSYVRGDRLDDLPQTIFSFLGLCENFSRDKNNLVVFFEPGPAVPTHAEERVKFWSVLQYLHSHDPVPNSVAYRHDPDDPEWDFPFAGRLFFVVGNSPSYKMHRSRNLGPCLTMIFQPREIFVDSTSGCPISEAARRIIRDRALQWDGIATHPALNTYGMSDNREWTQYFFSDDNSLETGRCPFLHCRRSGEKLMD